MTAIFETQNCDDFSTSTALPAPGFITTAAWAEAERRGLTDVQSRKFTQGFIHANQGRDDLHGEDCAYDAGYCAGVRFSYLRRAA